LSRKKLGRTRKYRTPSKRKLEVKKPSVTVPGNVVGIIPARSGSRRIPNKNLKMLAGYPLIYYTIREALKAQTLKRVIVSTDSQRYADVAKGYGAEAPFLQPKEISGDVGTTPVLIHCVNYLEKNEGYPVSVVVTLEPTSPFRLAKDIDDAVNKLFETGADSVVSVREISEPPHWMFKLDHDRMIPFLNVDVSRFGRITSKDLPKLYLPNGCVYVTRRDVLMNEKRVYGKNCRALIMPAGRSNDIDTFEDFRYAEFCLSKRKKR